MPEGESSQAHSSLPWSCVALFDNRLGAPKEQDGRGSETTVHMCTRYYIYHAHGARIYYIEFSQEGSWVSFPIVRDPVARRHGIDRWRFGQVFW